MTKYVYPVVFTAEKGYEIAVDFPDFPGCVTCGTDFHNAIQQAKEALRLHIKGMIDDNEPLPKPTPLSKIKIHKNELITKIEVEI